MQDSNTVRLLALLVFISSSVAAFCMGVMAYTYVVGSLPFASDSFMEAKAKADDRKRSEAKNSNRAAMQDSKGSVIRLDEEFLSSFAKELEKEREKLAGEKSSIEEQRKNALEILKQATDMQAKVEAKEKQVDELLKKVDKREMQNVAEMTKLITGIAGTDPATANAMLLSMEETLATRIFAALNKKLASQMISDALKEPVRDKAKAEGMKRLMKKLQTLSDELKGEVSK